MYQYLSAQVAREFLESSEAEDRRIAEEHKLRQWHLQSQRKAMARLRSDPTYRRSEAAATRERMQTLRADERQWVQLLDGASPNQLREILTMVRSGEIKSGRGVFSRLSRNATGL